MSQEQLTRSILGSVRNMSNQRKLEAQQTLTSLVEQMLLSKNRQTTYNTREEVQKAAATTVDYIRNLNRDLLLLIMSVDSQYFMKQVALDALLRNKRGDTFAISFEQENNIILAWLNSMPVTSVLRLFVSFTGHGKPVPQVYRLNTSRLRKLFLRYFFERRSDQVLLWAVKYRSKLKVIFRHVLGKGQHRALYNILQTPVGEYERATNLGKTVKLVQSVVKYSSVPSVAYESLAFILECPRTSFELKTNIFNHFYRARHYRESLKHLPFEIAWGIAQTYHKDMVEADVLALTQGTMSEKEKVRRSTTRAGIKARIQANEAALSAKEIIIKGYANGRISFEGGRALEEKANNHASTSSFVIGESLGILLDISRSMKGKEDAQYHPMADALVIKNMLVEQAKNERKPVTVALSSNPLPREAHRMDYLPVVEGDTSLTTGFVELLEAQCDSIFIITDGYENAEGQLLGEVIEYGRKITGCTVTQLTVNVAAEVAGARRISDKVANIAVQDPTRVKTQLLLETLKTDVEAGVRILIDTYGNRLLT